MIRYKIGEPVELHLEKPPITKEQYSQDVLQVRHFGKAPKNPLLSVQIAAYNEGPGLIACLEGVAKNNFDSYEIVLVDNGLDDETVEQLQDFTLTYIKAASNLGCTKGRNVGVAYCRGEYVVFIDADGVVKKNFLKNAHTAISKNGSVAVRGKVLPLEITGTLPSHYNLGDKRAPSLISTEGNSIWRRKDYAKVGGFEDSLAGGEGLVLCYRMVTLHGYDPNDFMYDPSFVLYHDFHSDRSHLAIKLRRQSIIRDAIQKRYPDIREFERSYNSKGITPMKTSDAQIATMAEEVRKQVAEDFADLYERKRQERYDNKALVSGDGDYDFTVVIPCYNLGELLLEAVASVMRQSIGSVQIIVVDDVSTDEETKVILRTLKRHVEVIHAPKNGGVAKARNLGLAQAKADFVLCLDADDTIEPTYLEKARNMFAIYPEAGIVSTWAQYFGAVNGTWKPQNDIPLKDALVGSPVPTASCFRRSIWQDVGGYDGRLRGYEDWELWINIIKHSWQVKVVPELLFNYYVRPDGKVNTSNKNAADILGVIINKHRQAFEEHLEYIVVEKHKQVATLRGEVRRLGSQSFKIKVANSRLRPVAKVAQLGKKVAKDTVQDYRSSQSIDFTIKSLRHKFAILANRIRVKIG